MPKKFNYSSLHILLVDDDEDDRAQLSEAINSVKVDLALSNIEDGEKLMQYLSNCNGNIPDLIFLDLNMPRKNGMECLREIRTNKKFKNLVIAIYSTSSAKKDIDGTFLAGANIYITKPTNFGVLKKIVSEILTINWQYHTSRLSKENFMMVR